MQKSNDSTHASISRRDAPVMSVSTTLREITASTTSNEPPTSKARRGRKSNASIALLPITPLHEVAPGVLDVDPAKARVVYLAPLTNTAAEKYLARTKGKSAHSNVSSDDDGGSDDGLGEDEALAAMREGETKNQQSPRTRMLSPVNPLLSKLMANHDKRLARRKAKQEKLCAAHKSVFAQRTYDDALAEKQRVSVPVKIKPRADRPEDDHIERLKRYIHSMPVTDEDVEVFKQTIKTYQRLQMEYRVSLMRDHTSPVGFNLETAWNRKLLEERHRLWVQTHDERFEVNRARKVQEDEKHERRIQETTTEHRTQMRLLREIRLRLALQSQMILPTIMLAAATQNWFAHLQRHWRQEQFSKRLRGIVRVWCRQRQSRGAHVQSAHLLIIWLQKSVAVKSVGFRVFRGIRNFVRRVKKIQRLWKVKRAKRLRNYLMLQKLWIEQETVMVDQAHDEFEKKLAKVDVNPVRVKRKATSKALSAQRNDVAWLTFVSPDIRNDVIKEYVRDQEIEFTRLFRHQEEDLYPQLVQTLRDESPNKARSYIRAVANAHALLGRVLLTLCRFPGALVGVMAVEPFDIRYAPVSELIMRARDRSPPDETATNLRVNEMQNDAISSAKLLQNANEEKKKQILAFLQRRQQFRSQLPAHPTTKTHVALLSPASAAANSGESAPEVEHLQPPDPEMYHEGGPDTSNATIQPISAQHAISSASNNGSTTPSANSHQPRPQVAYALVAVCANFRFLPPLADKTKEIANQLFHALTDSHFARFSRRGSKLLINPSLIEFQDTMKELAQLCRETDEDATFFLCLASHGARVTGGVNEGSYVLFSETRLSSEEELLLTALHENDLAKLIYDIPCKNKLLALELCQVKRASEKPMDEAPTIANCIHEAFPSHLYGQLVELKLSAQKKAQPSLNEAQVLSAKPTLFNTVILDSCIVKREAPVRNSVDSVSNFLHRLNDAFHGGAALVQLESGEQPTPRPSFHVSDICAYVKSAVEHDAKLQNDMVKAEYMKQMRTKYEMVAEFEDITHTPQRLEWDRLVDFTVGDIPAAPELAPLPPRFIAATLSSITLSWQETYVGFQPTTSIEVPTILGYHIQIRGDGRACAQWRRASDFQVLSFDQAFREKKLPPTETVVHGLPCDASFRFRIRARSAGGWGPFSDTSPAFRTRSFTTVHDTFSTVDSTFRKRGVLGLYELMQTYTSNRDVQRTAIEFLARVAVKDEQRDVQARAHSGFSLDLIIPIVHLVAKATQKFSEDAALARHSCLFIGHLALSSDAYRKAMLSICEPDRLSELLEQSASRFATTHADTVSTALWATARLRGVSRRQRISRETAARRIQGLYRRRKAREYALSLASAVYTQLVDPSTGNSYFYNATTKSTTWSLPSFLRA